MRSPALNELPPSSPGKTGWPWTEGSPAADAMPGGSPWPRISIVTPSYNQGQFLEETIRSVLLQGYPNLEYIIIDGGSTDNSVEIIRKYEPWLAYWVSERDRGQSHAINKGFDRASGEVLAWLNSDDVYHAGCLEAVGRYWSTNPGTHFLVGEVTLVDMEGNSLSHDRPLMGPGGTLDLCGTTYIAQPSTFFSRDIWGRCGPLDEAMHYAMDMDFWLRIAKEGVRFRQIALGIARFRRHAGTKSASGRPHFLTEMIGKYAPMVQGPVLAETAYVDRRTMICLCKRLMDGYRVSEWGQIGDTLRLFAYLSPAEFARYALVRLGSGMVRRVNALVGV